MTHQAINTDSTDTNESVLTRIVITAHVAKGAVSSELSHLPEESTVVDPTTDSRVVVVHSARRFERVVACPVATARAMFEAARGRHPGVPCELRFA